MDINQSIDNPTSNIIGDTSVLFSPTVSFAIDWLRNLGREMHEQLMDFVLPTVAVLVLLFWMRGRWGGRRPEEDNTSTNRDGDSTTVCEESDDDVMESEGYNGKSSAKKRMKIKKKKKKSKLMKLNANEDEEDEDDHWAPTRIGRSKLHPIASFRDRTGHQVLLDSVNDGDHPWLQKRQSVSVGPIMLTQCPKDIIHHKDGYKEEDDIEAKTLQESTMKLIDISAEEKSSTESPIYVCVYYYTVQNLCLCVLVYNAIISTDLPLFSRQFALKLHTASNTL